MYTIFGMALLAIATVLVALSTVAALYGVMLVISKIAGKTRTATAAVTAAVTETADWSYVDGYNTTVQQMGIIPVCMAIPDTERATAVAKAKMAIRARRVQMYWTLFGVLMLTILIAATVAVIAATCADFEEVGILPAIVMSILATAATGGVVHGTMESHREYSDGNLIEEIKWMAYSRGCLAAEQAAEARVRAAIDKALAEEARLGAQVPQEEIDQIKEAAMTAAWTALNNDSSWLEAMSEAVKTVLDLTVAWHPIVI